MKKLFSLSLLVLSLSINAQLPLKGLVAYFPFNGTVNDEGPNDNNGQILSATLTSDRFGHDNAAYAFNGINDHIVLPSSINTKLSNSSYSISIWVLPTDTTPKLDGYEFFNDRSATNWNYRYRIVYGLSNSQNLKKVTYIQSIYPGKVSTIYDKTPMIYTWTHYVISYNNASSVMKVYKNGEYVDSVAQVPFVTGDREINLGCTFSPNFPNGTAFFKGKLDDIAFWNRQLTPTEIAKVFNDGMCKQLVSVTDTLVINANLLGISPITYQNTIKVYPNPTKDFLMVDFGNNFSTLNQYSVKIKNALGSEIYSTNINEQVSKINMSQWTGNGIYFIQLVDAKGNTVDVKKIILQ
ncbi:LamG-like jellyroll fold domain-containing protein [Parabacteroides sp. FAFU027]|uniref:LamG-like jellyroll fold domain-containing protein n=1 Tax=Parabacteroides sp. FAFU027 TaxID=2922715 RepID=UPI001FAFA362|nr:LamG-like jellyroll fold domain-containing protein [Parabacteroides sp. FAFU027]